MGVIHTAACVAAPTSEKEMKIQLEVDKALNSEAIVA